MCHVALKFRKFTMNLDNLMLTWHLNFTKFHEISKEKCRWFHSTCHTMTKTKKALDEVIELDELDELDELRLRYGW